jgi:DNA-binding FrmR family transcriptional regulator
VDDRRLHRLKSLVGQLDALTRHLDSERDCREVAELVHAIDGAWAAVRSDILRGWLEECLLNVEQDDHVGQRLAAIERVGRLE